MLVYDYIDASISKGGFKLEFHSYVDIRDNLEY